MLPIVWRIVVENLGSWGRSWGQSWDESKGSCPFVRLELVRRYGGIKASLRSNFLIERIGIILMELCAGGELIEHGLV